MWQVAQRVLKRPLPSGSAARPKKGMTRAKQRRIRLSGASLAYGHYSLFELKTRLHDRMQEYGLASRPDYFGRGKMAKAYSDYIIKELIPYLTYKLPISPRATERAMAGYSLGGLSAMDIVWNHPEFFGKTGIFSGSFWWRKRDSGSFFYSDYRDRLMHLQVRRGKFKPGMKFWFQTGTLDELGDRNKNGVIDSIDDTMDLITELTRKGYRPFHDIQYLEIKDGKHNQETWAEAMPHFLKWAFAKE